MRKIIWRLPDGSIQVTTFATDDPVVQQAAVDKLFQDDRLPAGTSPVADGPGEDIDKLLPDRSERGKWRWRGGRVDPERAP